MKRLRLPTTTRLFAFGSRSFSDPFRSALQKEFGELAVGNNDEFDPDREETELNLLIKQDATLNIYSRTDNFLKHNSDFNGILYKYDLPIVNTKVVFRNNSALMVQDED